MNDKALDIYDIVKSAELIGISAHIKPDGDAIGSCLAMFLYLKKRLPNATVKVFLEKPGPSFENVPGYSMIDSQAADDRTYDAFIMIDTISERLGNAKAIFDNAKLKINIDHHVSNKGEQAEINYIVADASASAELVYLCMDKDYLDKDIASLLYMGIAHDTGVFKFSNTSPETMKIAGYLMSFGFDFSKLIDETFFAKSYAQLKVQGKIAYESRMYANNQIITALVTQEYMRENGVTKNDFEGVVSQLLLTKGTKASVFMYEKEPGLYKVSLRSDNDDVNVASVAVSIGGGGHVRAAGADFKGDPEEMMRTIIELIENQIKE